MELRRRLNPKYVFVILYVVAFVAFIFYGLQPAEAVDAYEVETTLSIPSIGLESNVTELEMTTDGLNTPDTIVGSYSKSHNKTFLVGHSTTVFKDLEQVKIGDKIDYDGMSYSVSELKYTLKDAVDMNELLNPAEKNTLVIMTCAGELLGNGDATHRFIITAVNE